MKDIVKGNVIVGYKKLSPAELGRTSSTTMTHIGLTKGFLNILNSDNDHKIEISNCKFYFQLNSSNSSCIVNCITQANGIKRSPKMTSVGNTKGTIVKEIKKIAFGNSQEYFLVWQVSETKSDFLLVEKDSEDFALIQDLEEGEFDEKKFDLIYSRFLLQENISTDWELVFSDKSLRSFAFKTFKIIHKSFGDKLLEKEKVFFSRKHGQISIQAVTFPNYFGSKKILAVFDSEQTKETLTTSKTIRFNPENLNILNQSFIYFSTQWSHTDDPTNLNYGELVTFVKAYGEGKYEVEYDEGNRIYSLYSVSNQLPIQKICFGSPGTGKSRLIKQEYGDGWPRITFHPELDYQGFVGAYKPTMSPISDVESKEEITYEYVPEAFIKAYCKAWKSKEPYYLIIEEINRGNCAQIFGDIFQLLDRDPKGYSEYPIQCSPDIQRFLRKEFENDFNRKDEYEREAGSKDFSRMALPNNLSLLATMNTSDQSLFPMDSAFKRRWDWQYVPIDYNDATKLTINVGEGYNWGKFISSVNKQVKELTKSEDKQLGNRFVSPRNGIITQEQFVSKVLFYLWTEIYKDEQGTGNTIFKNSEEDSEILFGDFFELDGKINESILMSFLNHILPKEKTRTVTEQEADIAGDQSDN